MRFGCVETGFDSQQPDQMILRGEKVILRPVTSKYIPVVIGWYKNSEIKKLEFISGKVKKEDLFDKKGKNFLIFAGANAVGFVNLEINKTNKSADFGILINRNDWGKGYGKDAGKLIVDFCFDILKLNRVELITYSHNIRAQKFFKSLGFKKEGVKKESLLFKGIYYDAIPMGILRSEWIKKH